MKLRELTRVVVVMCDGGPSLRAANCAFCAVDNRIVRLFVDYPFVDADLDSGVLVDVKLNSIQKPFLRGLVLFVKVDDIFEVRVPSITSRRLGHFTPGSLSEQKVLTVVFPEHVEL